ncbi:hypothetical protein GGS21DRAFT_440566 [Xylaria nigripes]|nr:hypothetical protein GGS21DRAFT_440566 [Xylaria nigripes]
MEPQEPPRPDPGLPGHRSTSFGRLFKKLSNKDSPSTSTPAATEGGPSQTSLVNRPRRHLLPTDADLDDHAIALQLGLDAAWPTRQHNRYRQIRALLVCWADNELINSRYPPAESQANPLRAPTSLTTSSTPHFIPREDGRAIPRMSSRVDMRSPSAATAGQNTRQGPFIPAAYQLASVLARRYGIGSQVWMIPTLDNPQDMLAGKINQFVEEYGGADNLLIFWYGGSAEFVNMARDGAQASEAGSGEVVWYGLRDELGISARAITKALGVARADVLMLNDSPFAQYVYSGHLAGPGTFELLGSGSMIPSNLDPKADRAASFTRTLTLMLDSPFLAAHGVSIPELHRKLLDMMSQNRLSHAPTSPISLAAAHSGMYQDGRRRRHNLTTVSRSQPVQIPWYPVYCLICQSAHIERETRKNIVLSRLNAPLGAQVVHARGSTEPRVRLDIKLERPLIDIRRWTEWLLNAPGDALEVQFKVVSKDK